MSEITPFEYEEEYLIIQVEKNGLIDEPFCRIQIQDIVNIFPLTSPSKASIETKIDSRIRLENPIFESIVTELEAETNKNEVIKAIQVLWEICKVEGDLNEYISNIGIDNLFKGLESRNWE
ncbi:MAG: hypothetical protein IPN88_17715 [Bacteroidetes bacterium]|nr:hypothetical protein [Bacteroidota bacterium]